MSAGKLKLDAAGKIVPTREAIAQVEQENPFETPANKWRLAQALTLLLSTKMEPDDVRPGVSSERVPPDDRAGKGRTET